MCNDPDEYHEPLWSSKAWNPKPGQCYQRGTCHLPQHLCFQLSCKMASYMDSFCHGRLVYTQPPRKIFRLVLQKNLMVSGCFSLPD